MNPNKTYIIQHKETKELFIARSGKSSWKQPGHAKNAWNRSIFHSDCEKYGLELIPDKSYYDPNRTRTPYFDEQAVFEITELKHEAHSTLDKAINVLKYVRGRCDYAAEQEIKKFLEEFEIEN